MNNIIKRKWNQNSMVIIEDLQGMAFQAESGGHTFQISGIDGEGNTVALSGTPAGVMLRSDGQDVPLTCSVSGGVVFATLPANAYVVPGRFGLTIFLTSDGQKTAIYAAAGTVGKTSSGTVAPPAGSDVVDLVNAIATAVATIPASYTDLMASVAPTYSSSGLYAVGSYAWYNGKLYRCTTPITSGETWTSGHWTPANLGSDLVDLKSALNSAEQTIVCSAFHAENVESGFAFSVGDVNPDTGAKTSTNYAAITGYKVITNDYFGMSTDDYYYRIAYTKTQTTGTGNVVFVTDYVKGTTKTNLRYEGATRYKVVVVKDLTGTVSMADYLSDVQSKCRYYKTIPYELDASLTSSNKAADAKAVGDIIFPLRSDVGYGSNMLVDSSDDFINERQQYYYNGGNATYAGFNTTDYIECIPGQKLKYRLCGYNGTVSGNLIILATVAYFRSDYSFLSSVCYPNTAKGIEWENEVTVPENAAYFKAMTGNFVVANPYVELLAEGIHKDIEDLQGETTQVPVKIAFVGDSLTQGLTGGTTGSYTFANKPYPTILKEFLKKHGFDVTVKNFGRRGLSAKSYWEDAIPSDGQWHSPASGEPGDTIDFDNTIDVAIIMLGTNGNISTESIADARVVINTATSGQTYPYTIQTSPDVAQNIKHVAAYCNIIEYIMDETDNHAQIILVAPIYANDDKESKVINSLPTVQALGERYQIPVINALYESGLGKFNKGVFYNQTDLLHLNQAGYHKFGTFIASKFSSLYSTFDMSELD